MHSKYNSLKNRSITPNDSIINIQKDKFIFDKEKKILKKILIIINNSFLKPIN